ncbi:MAG: hypothetical protein ACXV5H_07215 [Halobacteriota archaeon]
MMFDLIPGTVKRYEEISLKQGIELQVVMSLVPAIMERASVTIVDRVITGRAPSGLNRLYSDGNGRCALFGSKVFRLDGRFV